LLVFLYLPHTVLYQHVLNGHVPGVAHNSYNIQVVKHIIVAGFLVFTTVLYQHVLNGHVPGIAHNSYKYTSSYAYNSCIYYFAVAMSSLSSYSYKEPLVERERESSR